ncbi:MAG: T9SS C-terminal target domain-containing protein [Bacteroidetes bacterium]|nr:MAG: T9SS C-terminal target domain-containing protein [Bacteroidota bacterium]
MNKIYFTIIIGLCLFAAMAFSPVLNAQVVLKSDSVTMGLYYADEIYYSMKNGEVSFYARNSWDIAFRTKIMSSSIITNDGTSVVLWSYPKADTAGWATVDTSGLSTWTRMFNDPSDWENGAFSRNAQGHPDYGWGKYNDQTHDIVGDSLLIIKLRDGSFRKLRIIRKNSVNNIYYFRTANLDGTGQQDLSINCNNYIAKDFIGFSLETNLAVDYQPVKADWDIVFTKYMSIQSGGQPYPVTGVLSNDVVKSKKFFPVSLDYVDYTHGDWDSTRSSVGWEWKYIDTNYVYHIVDSTVYFVKSLGGDIYKLVFSKFAGSSTGVIVFETAKVAGLGITGKTISGEMNIYPNPAVNQVQVSFTRASSEPALLELSDLAGRILERRSLESGFSQLSLDVSRLGRGIYFIRISSQEGSLSKKVMISR